MTGNEYGVSVPTVAERRGNRELEVANVWQNGLFTGYGRLLGQNLCTGILNVSVRLFLTLVTTLYL